MSACVKSKNCSSGSSTSSTSRSVGAPYGRTDWQAFDTDGEPTDLDVLDVELPDDQFFDFTQADIDRELR